MSDSNHSSTLSVLDLVEEIIATRPAPASKPYGGRKRKYRRFARKGVVRLLGVVELSEFRAHVQRCIEARS